MYPSCVASNRHILSVQVEAKWDSVCRPICSKMFIGCDTIRLSSAVIDSLPDPEEVAAHDRAHLSVGVYMGKERFAMAWKFDSSPKPAERNAAYVAARNSLGWPSRQPHSHDRAKSMFALQATAIICFPRVL